MRQILVSKSEISKQLKKENITLREIYEYSEERGYDIVAVDKYFVVFSIDKWRMEDMLHHILQSVSTVSQHFKEY